MPNLDMPASDNTTVTGKKPLIVSDQQGHNFPYTLEQYKKSYQRVDEKLPDMLQAELQNELLELNANKRKAPPNISEEIEEPKKKKPKTNLDNAANSPRL